MKIMAAADIIGKGLDPRHPHTVIGHDGLFVAPSAMEAVQAPAVIAISAPEETLPPPAAPEPIVEDVVQPLVPAEEEPKKVEEEPVLALPSSEEPPAPVAEVGPAVEAPKKSGKASKTPKA